MARHFVTTQATRVGYAVCMTLVLACLPAFAPGIRAQGEHAGSSRASEASECMSCHTSEADALAAGKEFHADAPLVADWMIEEPRGCVTCHSVRAPRGRGADEP